MPKPKSTSTDLCGDIADTVAEVARLAAQLDDPTRNVLGVTSDRLDVVKARLAQQLRQLTR
jgi:hypothetical protein